MSSRNMSPRTK